MLTDLNLVNICAFYGTTNFTVVFTADYRKCGTFGMTFQMELEF
jgi:hypothetical protein